MRERRRAEEKCPERRVAPKPVVVAVVPEEALGVVTFRGAELPEFTPQVQCSHGTR